MKRLVAASLACALALTIVAVPSAAPVAACSGPPAPVDSFTAAVPAADTIVIGTVEALSDRDVITRFRLAIDEVLRGEAPAAIRFGGLKGGDQRSGCGDRTTVQVEHGDRLALALTGPSTGRPLVVEAVAFVGRSKPDRGAMPGMEQLPIRTVRRLSGVAADGSSSRHPRSPGRAADGLFTERVAPGVWRVRGLGNAHDPRTVRHLDVSADDRVWAASKDRAFNLVRRTEYPLKPRSTARLTSITAQPGGEALGTADDGIWRFSGGRVWYRLGTKADAGLSSPHTTSDGTVWALSERGLARLDGNTWTYTDWTEIGVPDGCLAADDRLVCDVSPVTDAPDGSLWLGFGGEGSAADPLGGIRRFDGTAWADVPGPMAGPDDVRALTSEPGGPVWALIADSGPDGTPSPLLARWDGQTWAVTPVPSSIEPGSSLVASPDDSVWLSRPLARFDGETWTAFDVPGRAGPSRSLVTDLSVAPDGSAWMVVRRKAGPDGTRPDGIYILDPDRATGRPIGG